MVVFRSSLRGLCRPFGPSEGEDGGSFLTMILGLPLLRELNWSVRKAPKDGETYDNGDFFPPGGVVLSMGVALEISSGPLEAAYLSGALLTTAGARGAYDRGLGCRSCTDIGAGLGAATAVDIVPGARSPKPRYFVLLLLVYCTRRTLSMPSQLL